MISQNFKWTYVSNPHRSTDHPLHKSLAHTKHESHHLKDFLQSFFKSMIKISRFKVFLLSQQKQMLQDYPVFGSFVCQSIIILDY